MGEVERARTLDCGDNSCAFAINRGGMRTNGGCRCLSGLVIHSDDATGWVIPRSRFNVIETHVREYRAAVDALREAAEPLADLSVRLQDALAALARLESGEGEE